MIIDFLSLIGVVLGVGSIIMGQYLEGGNLSALINGPAALIVIGGTLGAVFLQTPPSVFFRAMRISSWIFFPPRYDRESLMTKILAWSHTGRREGMLGLESHAQEEENLFARKGLELLIDGGNADTMRNILELDMDIKENFDLSSARVYEAMGGFSPTIGIIGAVLGLIHVMSNLGDPSSLGAGIAVAFVATIYGVGLANLIYIPMANKIRACVLEESRYREMIMEGLSCISNGENPRSIQIKLEGYLDKTN